MQPTTRSLLGRFATRTHRAWKTWLAVCVAVGVALLYFAIEIPGGHFELLTLICLGLGLALVILPGAVFLVMVLIERIVLAWIMRRARVELRQWAERRGWAYRRRVPRGEQFVPWPNAAGEVERVDRDLERSSYLPKEPKSRQLRDIVEGDLDGHPFFTATVARGMRAPETVRRLLVLELPCKAPQVSVVDKLLVQLWSAPGCRFESVHFNDRYAVQCRDRKLAHALLHPRALALFVDAPLAVERVDLVGERALVWLSPDAGGADLDAALGLAARFADFVPKFVR